MTKRKVHVPFDPDAGFTPRRDPKFRWATSHSNVAEWRAALVEWVAQLSSRSASVSAGNQLLEFARTKVDARLTPERYCRRDAVVPSFTDWLLKRDGRPRTHLINRVHHFFEWFLDQKLSASDDNGYQVRSPDHLNPVPLRRLAARKSETDKDPLPTRYLHELRQILMGDDWKWARRMKRDYVECTDSLTGERVRVWCPVRACAVALKLFLPLRTFQVRMLDSGEGDSMVYDGKAWVPNTGPHAPPASKRVEQGFLRCFKDPVSGEVITGFRPNTNKTADLDKSERDHGYDIPWEHRDVIAIVDMLRRWQTRYNPVRGPMPWSDVRTPEVRLSGVSRTGAVYFLFRDPNARHPNQPLELHRPGRLWTCLLAELEERMAARRETKPNGERIRLTREEKASNQLCPLFGLHSLRVSILTSLATEGQVPLHVLSKIVAGHSSLVMTLYYVKTSPAAISRTLNEATLKVDTQAQSAFIASLAASSSNRNAAIANSPAASAALSRKDSGLWTPMDTGICPVGGTRCGDGGPAIGKGRYSEVPGGQCINCRFHITGPAFLPHLVARFQTTAMGLQAAIRHRNLAERAATEAENKRFLDQRRGVRGAPTEVYQARNRVTETENRIRTLTTTLASAGRLVDRCIDAARHTPGLNIILAGSETELVAAVRQASEIELWDAVCQQATIYPCPEVDEAQTKRARAIDRMLMRHGQEAFLLKLPPDVEAAASTEMMRWLKAEWGAETTFALINGQTENIPDADAIVGNIAEKLELAAAAATRLPMASNDEGEVRKLA